MNSKYVFLLFMVGYFIWRSQCTCQSYFRLLWAWQWCRLRIVKVTQNLQRMCNSSSRLLWWEFSTMIRVYRIFLGFGFGIVGNPYWCVGWRTLLWCRQPWACHRWAAGTGWCHVGCNDMKNQSYLEAFSTKCKLLSRMSRNMSLTIKNTKTTLTVWWKAQKANFIAPNHVPGEMWP